MSKIQQLRLAEAEKLPGIAATGFDWWCRADGLLDNDDKTLKALTPKSLLAIDDGKAFSYMFVGPETITAQVFGLQWALSAPGHVTSDPNHEAEVAAAYAVASWLRVPQFHLLDVEIHPKGMPAVRVAYHRLILPTQCRAGRRYFSIFTQAQSVGLLHA